jgi:hypothetical protein
LLPHLYAIFSPKEKTCNRVALKKGTYEFSHGVKIEKKKEGKRPKKKKTKTLDNFFLNFCKRYWD